jgi:surface antigen
MAMGPWKGRKSHPRLAAIFAVLALLFGATAVTVGTATPAAAVTVNDYPDRSMPCEHFSYYNTGTGYWCDNYDWGPKHTEAYNDPSEISSRGYAYRNCTDYVAWRLISEGVSASDVRGLGNGGEWYNNAPASKRSLTPAAGDAAVKPISGSDTYGHVAYVESVNADGTITVTEFNHHQDGNPGTRTATPASMGFTEFVDFGVNPGSSTTTPTDYSQLGVGMAFNPTSGLPTIAARGPNNTLYVYWQTSSGSWTGPLGIGGAGSAYSAPSIAFNPVTGLPTVVVQGPGNRLWVYWQTSSGSWTGPLGVGAAGSTLAAPSLAFGPSGNATVAVRGPNDALWIYWMSAGSWYGPLGVGGANSTVAAPSIAVNPVSGLPTIAVQGPSNTLRVYWQTTSGSWTGPLGVGASGSTYAVPSLAFGSGGNATVAVRGPDNTLRVYWTGAGSWTGPLGIGATDSTYSAPSLAVNPGTDLPSIAVQGPGNRLWLYWQQASGSWTGPLGIAGSGSTYSAPAISFNPSSNNPTIAAESVSNTLWAYWANSGAWYGPLGIGGVGSTYH